MHSLKKIKNYYDAFTVTDKKIADYIINNTQKVTKCSIYELSDAIGVSTASISRFVRKIGIKNFTVLKADLIRSITMKEKEVGTVEDILQWSTDYSEMSDKIVSIISQVCDDALKINDISSFNQAIEWIEQANIIYFVALGQSVLAARDLQHKLMRLLKRCIYLEDSNYGLQNIAIATLRDVIIAVSFDGKSPSVNHAVKKAREKGVKVISITRYGNTPLKALSDLVLYVPNIAVSESHLSSIFRRYGQMTVVDMIYIGLAKKMSDSPEKAIDKYIDIVNNLRQEK